MLQHEAALARVKLISRQTTMREGKPRRDGSMHASRLACYRRKTR